MLTFEDYLTYKNTERFLESLLFTKPLPHFAPSKVKKQGKTPFGTRVLRSFLHEMGDPHLNNRYIHIAGTSGKTSTSYFTASLLQAQGYRTGLFTSPHICTTAEYLSINGQLPPVSEFIGVIERLKPLIDREYEQKAQGMISHFECLLAAALEYFAGQQTDYVVLEAGLGGRHDATNVIEQSDVSVITNIGLDHTNILGETLQEIASEKIGILKPGCPLLTAEQQPEILDLFQREARKTDSHVQHLKRDFRVEHVNTERNMTTFDYLSEQHRFDHLSTPVRGSYQAYNAALAIRALELVSPKHPRAISEEALRQGLMETTIPGRYEIVHNTPQVILDGAHNSDKIARLVSYLKTQFQSDALIIVCAFSAGKNPSEMLRSLLEVSERFYLTRILTGFRESEEPLYLKSLLTNLSSSAKSSLALDPFTALDMAIDDAQKLDKAVCVTGSLYLVSYLRQRWFPEQKLLG